ncbi:MAG: flagellar M-ring protein FliF C-terminal domain-containing protein [Planctomycetota bacterium]|jgi:flagellar M-ring protein FliF
MNYLRKTLERARAVLAAMPTSQRYSLVALAAVVAISLVMLVTWSGKDTYAPVIPDLTGDQVMSIQTALEGTGIDYKFMGTTLLVPSDKRESVLMVLTEKGALPADISSSFGFEDLVEPDGFNLKTSAREQMEYNIALGNMLARAISSAPDISSAQVHIASSRDGHFGPKVATAGVNIRTKGAARLPELKLIAICRLVAASVGPQLPPESVVVANLATNEPPFSIEDGDSPVARASNRVELQQNLEQYYRKEVEEFFRPLFGHVQTLVAVKVDASTKAMSTIEYEVTEQKSRESTEQTGGPEGGDNLTRVNVGASVQTGGESEGAKSEESETEKRYSPSKTVTTDTPPGEVTDIQISVMADLGRVEEAIKKKLPLEGEEETVTADRLKQEYTYWEDILRTGLPFMRDGDASKVSNVLFTAEPFGQLQLAAAGVAEGGGGGRILNTVMSNWQGGVLVVLAAVALLMIRGVARRPASEEAALATLEKRESDEEVLLPEVEVDVEERRARKMRESIEEMVQRDPQAAIGLIRRWIVREL